VAAHACQQGTQQNDATIRHSVSFVSEITAERSPFMTGGEKDFRGSSLLEAAV
jgi:hypothetical protein